MYGQIRSLRAHHVEHVGHARAVEIAALGHHLFERRQLRVVGEEQEIAGLGEIDLRREERRRAERRLAARGEIGERGAEQRAADAIAEHVDLLDAGLALHGVGRASSKPFDHVVLEGLVRELGVRVDPGHEEHREALVDGELDEALRRA